MRFVLTEHLKILRRNNFVKYSKEKIQPEIDKRETDKIKVAVAREGFVNM
jgi:hypothetical protein